MSAEETIFQGKMAVQVTSKCVEADFGETASCPISTATRGSFIFPCYGIREIYRPYLHCKSALFLFVVLCETNGMIGKSIDEVELTLCDFNIWHAISSYHEKNVFECTGQT